MGESRKGGKWSQVAKEQHRDGGNERGKCSGKEMCPSAQKWWHSHSHITCFLSPKPPEQLISAHPLLSAISPAAANYKGSHLNTYRTKAAERAFPPVKRPFWKCPWPKHADKLLGVSLGDVSATEVEHSWGEANPAISCAPPQNQSLRGLWKL